MALVVDGKAQTTGSNAATKFFATVERVLASPRDHRLAFDCEGVRLGRYGSIEIVSLCFEMQSQEDSVPEVFLVDLMRSSSDEKWDTEFSISSDVVLHSQAYE